MVVTIQSFLTASAQRPVPRRWGLGGTIAVSVLLHAVLLWYVVSQLISGMPVPDEQPIAIEITRVEPVPPKPLPPEIKPDDPLPLELPPPPVRLPPVVRDAAIVDPSPLQPAPEAPVTRPAPSIEPPAPAVPRGAPTPTYRAPVNYPARAQTRGISGAATVEIVVGAGGSVDSVRIVDETPAGYRFGEAAADSVWKWKFADAQPGTYRVTVRFKLD